MNRSGTKGPAAGGTKGATICPQEKANRTAIRGHPKRKLGVSLESEPSLSISEASDQVISILPRGMSDGNISRVSESTDKKQFLSPNSSLRTAATSY